MQRRRRGYARRLKRLDPRRLVFLEALRAVGAEPLYLPPYSPDPGPIEMAWSKMKAIIRSGAPPTFRRLVSAIGAALKRISTTERRNYFQAAGVPAT